MGNDPQNGEKSDRLHLTGREVEKLIDATTGAAGTRARDRCLLLLSFRHGFRVSEVCGLPLDHVDIESRVLHVKRLKRGLSTTHPLRADELRAIKAWLKLRVAMKPGDRQGVFCQRAAQAVAPFHGQLSSENRERRRFPALLRPSSHAAPCLRLCPCRPGRGYAAHSGLSRTPED